MQSVDNYLDHVSRPIYVVQVVESPAKSLVACFLDLVYPLTASQLYRIDRPPPCCSISTTTPMMILSFFLRHFLQIVFYFIRCYLGHCRTIVVRPPFAAIPITSRTVQVCVKICQHICNSLSFSFACFVSHSCHHLTFPIGSNT